MKVLLDTDVLMDVALGRTDHGLESRSALEWCQQSPRCGIVAWHSISNLFYLLNSARSGAMARLFIGGLLEFIEIRAGSTTEVRRALQLEVPDFEDALQVVIALVTDTDFIVTRNLADYRRSPVPAVSPAEFLRKVSRQ